MADKLIYVNQTKADRAKDILALVTGARVTRSRDEEELRGNFMAFLTDAKVDPKGADALEFVYEKLGGLVRTEKEQAVAEARKKEAQSKVKRRMIE